MCVRRCLVRFAERGKILPQYLDSESQSNHQCMNVLPHRIIYTHCITSYHRPRSFSYRSQNQKIPLGTSNSKHLGTEGGRRGGRNSPSGTHPRIPGFTVARYQCNPFPSETQNDSRWCCVIGKGRKNKKKLSEHPVGTQMLADFVAYLGGLGKYIGTQSGCRDPPPRHSPSFHLQMKSLLSLRLKSCAWCLLPSFFHLFF